jgi:hypothetical protein
VETAKTLGQTLQLENRQPRAVSGVLIHA